MTGEEPLTFSLRPYNSEITIKGIPREDCLDLKRSARELYACLIKASPEIYRRLEEQVISRLLLQCNYSQLEKITSILSKDPTKSTTIHRYFEEARIQKGKEEFE